MVKKSSRFLHFLLIIILLFVLSGCNILDYSYSKSKGKTTLRFEDLSDPKRYDIFIKEKSDLEFGYSDFEIKEGQIIVRIIYKDKGDIVFEEILSKNSPNREDYKLKDIEPGEYLLELIGEETIAGKIKIHWSSSKIRFSL
jgi:hypothetical protein